MASATLSELNARFERSDTPSPVAFYGYANHPETIQTVRYDGTVTTFFLLRHGADWRKFKEFWRANQVGRVTDDLHPGKMVQVEKIRVGLS